MWKWKVGWTLEKIFGQKRKSYDFQVTDEIWRDQKFCLSFLTGLSSHWSTLVIFVWAGLRPYETDRTKVDQWLLRPVCNRATSKTKEIGVERSTLKLKLGQAWKIFSGRKRKKLWPLVTNEIWRDKFFTAVTGRPWSYLSDRAKGPTQEISRTKVDQWPLDELSYLEVKKSALRGLH